MEYSILGSILGSPYLGNYHIPLHNPRMLVVSMLFVSAIPTYSYRTPVFPKLDDLQSRRLSLHLTEVEATGCNNLNRERQVQFL